MDVMVDIIEKNIKQLLNSQYKFNVTNIREMIKFVFGCFSSMTNQLHLKYKMIHEWLPEPIIIIINDNEDNDMAFCVSVPFINHILFDATYKYNMTVSQQIKKNDNIFDNKKNFKYHFSTAKIGEDLNNNLSVSLSHSELVLIVKLYLIADHLYYHYLNYVRTGNSDYQHLNATTAATEIMNQLNALYEYRS